MADNILCPLDATLRADSSSSCDSRGDRLSH